MGKSITLSVVVCNACNALCLLHDIKSAKERHTFLGPYAGQLLSQVGVFYQFCPISWLKLHIFKV